MKSSKAPVVYTSIEWLTIVCNNYLKLFYLKPVLKLVINKI